MIKDSNMSGYEVIGRLTYARDYFQSLLSDIAVQPVQELEQSARVEVNDAMIELDEVVATIQRILG